MRTYRLKMNLQFFSQEKTEKATPQKRQDSRKKGQVARSAEIPSAFMMIGVFLFMSFLGGWIIEGLQTMIRSNFVYITNWTLTEQNVDLMMKENVWQAAVIAAPLMGISLVMGVVANYMQVGFLFSTDPLHAKLERINPLKGAKRIFSARTLVELLKSLIKITFISAVTFTVLWNKREEVMLISQKSIGDAISLVGSLIVQTGLSVGILLLFLALLDYVYQKYDFEKNIRMSKQDIKDEYKKSEGDPLIKSKIKEKQRALGMNRMIAEIPSADVVITNPTHFAVALKYDPNEMDKPTVVAKGMDYVALKIKEKAKEHDIITTENVQLARALYHQVEIGDGVPEDLFKAVAEILAYVYSIKGYPGGGN
ncbi:flagellar biosynthesis protein FlhB [Pseudalkalibacillus hwajinpoensis]|uniref:Flagellar biosynthetic protein FlhB n=1 Tax=Guptibacillus hwajinpoensis TaxID=208199 RepID=A0A4U1MJI0_9BACL|nr:flagellar biosynthesis protein FlhB [Pseudalkalibacillus hwajinpoensis]TKD70560.1 flagellar biosynthesis protein FlhB [Pseudalkalibacillus hwajinpoensis]